jgi:hypothetical protein
LNEENVINLTNNDMIYDYFYVNSSSAQVSDKNYWQYTIFDVLKSKINKIFTILNSGEDFTSSSLEQNEIVPYNLVKKLKGVKLGTKFISVPKK